MAQPQEEGGGGCLCISERAEADKLVQAVTVLVTNEEAKDDRVRPRCW